ncbi:MAG: hypothetical protein KAS73_00415 [Candidatus Sabulitectum sp.]|nr:hypothetical protein [Candidatus Sabulitectum sp.]
MRTLSYLECIPLIEALQEGVCSTGITRALIQFGRSDSNPVNQSANSIFQWLTKGMDLQTSFQKALPKLPDPITRILTSSILNSVLDHALDDTLQELQSPGSSEEILKNLNALAFKYESMSNTMICNGCFERDLKKLLARAETEDATEVLLEQEGESFLHQRFISGKLIHIIEPSHSLVYKTLLERLDSACRNDGDLRLSEQVIQVSSEKSFSFDLARNGKDILRIVFNEADNGSVLQRGVQTP